VGCNGAYSWLRDWEFGGGQEEVMIAVLLSNSVGWDRPLYVRVIREHGDAPGSYPFTLCVRDLRGNLVLSRSFVYDGGREEQTFAVDVSGLSGGIYQVYIYNWNNCSPPSNVLTFRYWLHKIERDAYLSLGDGWDFRRTYLFMLYVYDKKLFWKYLINTSETVIPAGVPVYIEATDASGNAFVGSVTATGSISLRPNMKVPFMAVFRIIYDRPIDDSIYRAFTALAGFAYRTYVHKADDYTVELGIVKTEPGLGPLGFAAIVLAIGGATAMTWMWYDREVRRIELEGKKLDKVDPLIKIQEKITNQYFAEVDRCRNDLECIRLAQYKYFGPLQMINSAVGSILSTSGISRECDGLNVGGVCIPWWVVAVIIFVGGLLVISAVRR
jgi:hypothetical protein